MKIRTYKYRIYPTKSQEILINKTFGCVRWVYNYALNLKGSIYKIEGKSISIFSIDKELNKLKHLEGTKWLQEVSAQALQSSLRNLDSAYTKFFRDKRGFPKFKSKNDRQSFQIPQGNQVNFTISKFYTRKFSEGIKCIFDRQFQGKIKTSTISKTKTGKYFASLVVEEDGDKTNTEEPKIESCVGIDLGIKIYATLSDGNKVENPKNLNKKLKKLKRLNKRHSKKVKGSKNREKSRKKLAVQHEKVANARKDFLHKLTTKLAKNQDYQSFAIENLAVNNMVKNRKLARSISDCAWGTFREFLQYKAARAGKAVLVIGRFEPSSKMCSCGKINSELSLKDRFWGCACGLTHDRDILAANNIRDFAFMKQNTKKDLVGQGMPKPSRKTKKLVEIPVRELMK